MNKIIGVDATVLAGLQIDMLQKVRAGQINLEQIRWFNHLTKGERCQITGLNIEDDRFMIVAYLNVTVPDDYVHVSRLADFRKIYSEEFHLCNDFITDFNFDEVTVRLVPGSKYEVKIVKLRQMVSSNDCLGFLSSEEAVLVGAQGLSLVYEQWKGRLPLEQWAVSFDRRESLPVIGGYHKLPILKRYSGNNSYDFDLRSFETGLDNHHYLLCFCEIKDSSSLCDVGEEDDG